MPPFTFSALRTLLAAAVLALAAQLIQGRHRPAGRALWFWAGVGLLQLAIPYGIVFWAETRISSGLTAMVFATYPAFTAVWAHFLVSGEPLTPAKTLAGITAAAAVALLVGSDDGFATGSLWPATAVLLASVVSALANVLVKRHGTDTSTLWLTAIQVGSSAVLLALLAVLLEFHQPSRWTASATASVLYLGLVVTVGCFSGLFWLLKRLDTTLVSMAVVIETAVAVLIGAAVLGEHLGSRTLGGLALVVVSIVLVVGPRRAGGRPQGT